MASSTMSDRWLWLALGAAAFIAAKGIQYAMSDILSLTAIDRELPPEEAVKEQAEESISLSTLRTLCDSPNSRIATAARSIIVQQFASDFENMKQLQTEMLCGDDFEHSRRARQAMLFLKEWGDSDFYTQNEMDPEPELSSTELREMALEILRLRPGVAGASVNDRSISLAEELGLGGEDVNMGILGAAARELEVESGENVDYEQLFGDLGILARQPVGDGFDGHLDNARQLGVSNFAGLDASRLAPDGIPAASTRNSREAQRRSRREAMVIQSDDEPGGENDSVSGRQSGWWVV